MTSPGAPSRGAAGGGARPRVFIVDDHGLFRSGVRMELGTDVDVIGEAADVDSAVEQIGAQEPDVVLLDVHLPGGGGQAVVSAIRQAHPQVRFLALSASDAPEDVIAVIRAGARGYVTKTISGDELVDAIRRIAAGASVFSPRLAGFVRDTGKGFDPAHVAPDRHGISESIIGRVQRLGGTAVLSSQPGAGTEVELRIPRGRL